VTNYEPHPVFHLTAHDTAGFILAGLPICGLVCKRCGALVVAHETHDKWHRNTTP
jgi:hypothetical protein